MVIASDKPDSEAVLVEEENADPDEELAQIELSVNAVKGLAEPRTLKLMGPVSKHPVIVLIDCGPTHNGISSKLVRALQVEFLETKNYGVMIGNGQKLPGGGICR